MTTQTRLAMILGGALLTGGLLAGCTSDDDPQPKDSTSSGSSGSSPSGSATTELKDRSSEVLANPPTKTAIATTKAKESSTFRGSTFTFYGLSRTDTGTILTYTVTGGTGSSSPTDSLPRAWENSPTLLTPTHAYRVVTFKEETEDWAAVANPIYSIDQGKESAPLDVLYPPLPEGTTSVKLTGPWFQDVTVPVTDATTG